MRLGDAFTMILGKIRRGWMIAFQKRKVAENLAHRRGSCSRCGACCKILFQCPAYDESSGEPKCLIYNDRPGVCGLFPIDARDLKERNLVMPGTRCGYYFADVPKPIVVPVRWGPTRATGAKAKIPNGTLMILKSFFKKPGSSV